MIATLALLACAPHLPPAPVIDDWSWEVDRSALPATELEILRTSTVALKDAQVHAGGDRRGATGPVNVLLVRHPTEGAVLVDTGYGRRTASDIGEYPGALVARTIGLVMERPAVDLLAARGIGADDVRHVVLTHLHTDHVGGVEDFPGARIWVSADEWAAGAEPHVLRGYDPVPYTGRDADELTFEGTSSYGPFPGHVDLFGDGSVIALPAPGHTVGSIAVLVNLPERSVLYLGDAAWADINWMEPVPKGYLPRAFIEDDWRRGMDALWRIRAWHERHPELEILSGHDPADMRPSPPAVAPEP